MAYSEIIFDVETKKFFDEIATSDPSELGVSIVSIYQRGLDDNLIETSGKMQSFWEDDFAKMWDLFSNADRIIGFNSIKFDAATLKPYAPYNLLKLNHFDIMDVVKQKIGRRIGLNAFAKDTLGKGKIGAGDDAIKYWAKGDPESLEKLKKYCEMDVLLTRDLYDFGLKNKFLKYTDRWNTPRKVEVDFSYPAKEINTLEQSSLF